LYPGAHEAMANTTRSAAYFSLAVIVLGGSALAMEFASLTIIKKGLPIRKPLTDMTPRTLGPYELVASRRLSTDIIGDLGTEEYIEWHLRDTRIDDANRAYISLFVTYYTDVLDQVPHVPEECHNQAGSTMASDGVIEMRSGVGDETIEIRRLGFNRPKVLDRQDYVYYVINVNGSFFTGRLGARIKMSDSDDTHLYYSKVEITFSGRDEKELPQLDRRAKELMDATSKELFKSYWPPRGTERGGYDARGLRQGKPQ